MNNEWLDEYWLYLLTTLFAIGLFFCVATQPRVWQIFQKIMEAKG